MFKDESAKRCLSALLNNGMDKAQVHLVDTENYEMNVAADEISLLRTTFDKNLSLKIIKDGKEASMSINKTDDEAIKEAIDNLNKLYKTVEKDDAKDISCNQEPKEFTIGDEKPDLARMYDMLNNFMKTVKERYPKVGLEEAYLYFTKTSENFVNSNGVDFKTYKGMYEFVVAFSSKDGEKTSSVNYSMYSTLKLDKDLIDCGSIDTLLRQSSEQTDTKTLEGKFEGDVIITPDCLAEMIDSYVSVLLSDSAMISGSSILKDKLTQKVASDKLSIHSKPISEEIRNGYFLTQDGFEAKNSTIIDKGILKAFQLSLYGANKTNNKRALNDGSAYVIDPGDKSFDEIVKSIDKGIMLGRFSGGHPGSNGDFSGIAKNSYYIENGEIKYPISETMITANLYKMFNDVKDISKERIDFGRSLLPWVCVSNIMISGK